MKTILTFYQSKIERERVSRKCFMQFICKVRIEESNHSNSMGIIGAIKDLCTQNNLNRVEIIIIGWEGLVIGIIVIVIMMFFDENRESHVMMNFCYYSQKENFCVMIRCIDLCWSMISLGTGTSDNVISSPV